MSLGNFKKRFGDIALEKGYITEKQLADALDLQKSNRQVGVDNRLIGSILYRQGIMGIWEVIEVLQCLENKAESETAEPAEEVAE